MRQLLFRNLGLKILALCLAVVLWFLISGRGVSEITLEVPIEYVNIPPGYEIVKKDRDTVRVSLFGSEVVLRSIKPEDLRVYVDLKDAQPAEGSYRIKKRNIKVPPALTISNVTPPSVNVVIEKTVRKEVPVRPDITGEPAAGRHISEVTIKPDRVVVEGPESVLRRLTYVRTEPIDVTGLDSDSVMKVNVVSDVTAARLMTGKVDVHIKIKEGNER
ncbi:MAG TPA: hypothetical protein ENJ04_04945 [Nitrospirae bacterium]|nr:hypothetical protein [Nitrospirota bacterium]